MQVKDEVVTNVVPSEHDLRVMAKESKDILKTQRREKARAEANDPALRYIYLRGTMDEEVYLLQSNSLFKKKIIPAKHPQACIVTRVDNDPNSPNVIVSYAASIWNPLDVFHRKQARSTARKHLKDPTRSYSFVMKKPLLRGEVTETVVTHFMTNHAFDPKYRRECKRYAIDRVRDCAMAFLTAYRETKEKAHNSSTSSS